MAQKTGTEKIVKEFKNKYPQKIVYLEKENGGLSHVRIVRNRGFGSVSIHRPHPRGVRRRGL